MSEYWIFTREVYDKLNEERMKAYAEFVRQRALEDFDDCFLLRFHLKNIVKLVLSRKSSQPNLMLVDKVLETAIMLFRRYFLVSSFINQEPTQVVFACIYVAMKLEEMDDVAIKKAADKFKQKSRIPQSRCKHFGEPGYPEQELKIFTTINYQFNYQSLIRPIENLMSRLKVNATLYKAHMLYIEKDVRQVLQNIYFSDLIFLIPGPKLALAAMLLVLKKYTHGVEDIDKDGDMTELYKDCGLEIDELISQVKGLPEIEPNQSPEQKQKCDFYMDMMRDNYKKPTLKMKMSTMFQN